MFAKKKKKKKKKKKQFFVLNRKGKVSTSCLQYFTYPMRMCSPQAYLGMLGRQKDNLPVLNTAHVMVILQIRHPTCHVFIIVCTIVPS